MLYLQNIGFPDSNAKDLSSFGQKMTELEQILFVPVDFSEIRKFSKIAVFKDFGVRFEIRVMSTILGVGT